MCLWNQLGQFYIQGLRLAPFHLTKGSENNYRSKNSFESFECQYKSSKPNLHLWHLQTFRNAFVIATKLLSGNGKKLAVVIFIYFFLKHGIFITKKMIPAPSFLDFSQNDPLTNELNDTSIVNVLMFAAQRSFNCVWKI